MVDAIRVPQTAHKMENNFISKTLHTITELHIQLYKFRCVLLVFLRVKMITDIQIIPVSENLLSSVV